MMIMNNNIIDHKIFHKTGREITPDDEVLKKINALIARYPAEKQKSALLSILHIMQEENGGHLDVDIMDYVAGLLKIQPVEVYEVATFYTQYYLEETGKYVIEVCRTGPCAACGAEDIQGLIENKLNIRDGQTTTDKLFTLKTVECLGACGNAPVMQINTVFYENLTEEKIDTIIAELRNKANQKKSLEEKWTGKFY
jgi:NADH-quinone oxidoreductase subunit E